MTPAQKASRTRKVNQAMMHRIKTIEQPGKKNLQEILTYLMDATQECLAVSVQLWFSPPEGSLTKLKHGTRCGTLVGFQHGFFLRVKPDGYKTAGVWHPAFWRLKKT